MELKQKRLADEVHFNFGDEKLHYYCKDKSGSEKFSVDYLEIGFDATRELVQKNAWYKMAGVFWILIGALQTIYLIKEEGEFKLSIWLLIGAISYVVYIFSAIKYSVFHSDKGNIFIIQDKQHDKIVKELKIRRNNRLKNLYGVVDPENEPEKELEKFDWLLAQEAITQHEYDQAKQDILSRKNQNCKDL